MRLASPPSNGRGTEEGRRTAWEWQTESISREIKPRQKQTGLTFTNSFRDF